MFFSSAADLRQFHPGPVHVVDAGRLPGRRPADLRVAARAAASGRQVVRHRLGSARNLLQVSAVNSLRAFIGINKSKSKSGILLFMRGRVRNEDERFYGRDAASARAPKYVAHSRDENESRELIASDLPRVRNVGHIKQGGKSRWPVCQTDLMMAHQKNHHTLRLDASSQFHFMSASCAGQAFYDASYRNTISIN
jgi:hypothetical protein